ncbi:ROK family protein [Bergeyella cardium]|uniref:ROK family protein n=1 Tax=Bergeyella cardium TaxID=1585976 RepID=A0A6P1QS90_9FLAO|nr:ROK family protein [Bergeyella cardium]QHN64535.1 ROK family protein [Bergeyella cardium]WHE33827.1 ROK family protein [Bergeyella cardium]WHF60477.1 ROK family protein [Bergeyella cardium]
MSNTLAIGIDVGGTNTKFGIVNKQGQILMQDRIKTNERENAEGFIEVLAEKLLPMIEQNGGVENFIGIGMGAPNANYYKGTIEYAANLKWKGVIPMAELIEKRFGLPVKMTNDANAAAVGEQMYGVAKGLKHFITITLGTGVGAGVIIDGKIVVGHNGFAGELGHIVVRHGGRLHKNTGIRGSLESYASATGLRDTAIEFLQRDHDRPSLLRDYTINELTSETVFNCAEQGDSLSNEIFEYTGQILGEALATFVHFSAPEAIVLFGGLTKAGNLLMKPTRQAMEDNLLEVFKNQVKILYSDLKEADAAILGASALVW